MLGQLSGQHQAHGCLNLATAECRFFVVRGKLARLFGNAAKNVIDERVHNGHALFGNPRVGVDLFVEKYKEREK